MNQIIIIIMVIQDNYKDKNNINKSEDYENKINLKNYNNIIIKKIIKEKIEIKY